MNTNSDTRPLMTLHDVRAAFGLLTRLPVPVDTALATARGASASWAYPLVGVGVALLAGFMSALLIAMGVPTAVAAAVCIATLTITTGAMHEDGLADTADGLWGGWDRARRLAIMKDSHIGAYGVIALILSLLIHWSALNSLFAQGHIFAPLVVMAALSRANMVLIMHVLPNARDTGLSQTVGRPARKTTFVAIGIAALTSLICIGLSVFAALLIALCAALSCGLIAQRKIGGQTGDILGATQQVSQIAVIATLAAIAP